MTNKVAYYDTELVTSVKNYSTGPGLRAFNIETLTWVINLAL